MACSAPNLDQFVRVFNAGQRIKENSLDPRKDSGVCADAQGQSDRDREREAWSLPEHSEAVPQVLPEDFHCVPGFSQ